MLPQLTLVLGGISSGKSVFAEGLVTDVPGPWHYIATAQARDDEMAEKIRLHRLRRGEDWVTHEAPRTLPQKLREKLGGAVLVDCASLWLTNLLLEGADIQDEIRQLSDSLKDAPSPVVVVSNEVGQGGISDNDLARRFASAQGLLNQQLAAQANRVILVSAGLPLTLKDEVGNG